MNIALCSPVDLRLIATHLRVPTEGVAAGLGSTAITPLITEFLDRGHEVMLFTLSHDVEKEERYHWGPFQAFVGHARRKHMTRTLFHTEINYLRKAIKEQQPEFVNAHWTYEFALGALASSRPTLVTVHDLPWNVLRYFRDVHRTLRLAMAYAVALQCRRYTAVSTDAANHFRRYLRPDAQIEVIPNFCSNEILQLPPHLPAPAPPLTFATVLQGWTRQKNGKAAIEAFQLVRRTHPETRLLMFGDGYESGGPAHAWALHNACAEGITFRGLLPYPVLIQSLRQDAHVLVHPSLNEAFSKTILDAMGLGKPVVAGRNTPGVGQLLGADAGIMVDVRRVEEVAMAMRRFCLDRRLIESMGKSAKERAKSEFNGTHVVEAYEQAYRHFMDQL